MKTSRAQRLEEWQIFNLNASNGRLVNYDDVRRWSKLNKEFYGVSKSVADDLKPLKVVDNQ